MVREDTETAAPTVPGEPSPGERIHQALLQLREPAGDRRSIEKAAAELCRLIHDGLCLFLKDKRFELELPADVEWDDVAQDVLMRIVRNGQQFRGDGPGQAFSWVRKVILNRMYDLGGRAARRDQLLRSLAEGLRPGLLEQACANGLDAAPTARRPELGRRYDGDAAMMARWKLQLLCRLVQSEGGDLGEAAWRQVRTHLESVLGGVSTDDQVRALKGTLPTEPAALTAARNVVFQRRKLGKSVVTSYLEAEPAAAAAHEPD